MLAVYDGQKLIGQRRFAIDGVKLPGNASTHRSGTRAEFTQRAEKLEQAAQPVLQRHRENEARELEPDVAAKTTVRIARLAEVAQQPRQWLASRPEDRHGPTLGLRTSNCTGHESAEMATGKGVVQGYAYIAVVYARQRSIAGAQAHGIGFEEELRLQVVEDPATMSTTATMHTAPNRLHDKSGTTKQALLVFAPNDFAVDADACTFVCPAGESRYRTGASNVMDGFAGAHFRHATRDCAPCALRATGSRKPGASGAESTPTANRRRSRGIGPGPKLSAPRLKFLSCGCG